MVLRYIKDAPLEQSGRWARQIAEGLQLEDIKDKVSERFSAEGMTTEAGARAQLLPTLTEMEAGFTLKLQESEAAWEVLFAAVKDRLTRVETVSLSGVPKFVANISPHAKALHIPRNFLVAHCGWAWGGNSFARPMNGQPPSETLCKRCRKVERLIQESRAA